MSNLLPRRYNPNFFPCELATASLKELSEHLEFPFFGLSRQPCRGVRRFENDHGNYIELHPGLRGLPTIQDQDVLIYCMSVAMAEVRQGRPVPERVRMTASDLLRFANRTIGGRQYDAVEAAIYRLTTLTLKTNLRGEDAVYTRLFGVLDEASMVRRRNRRDRPGALLGCEIVLSRWIREALEKNRVLTLHGDYFRLRTPTDRAVYQLVRKHCGEQPRWAIGLEKLQAKIGSSSPPRNFRGFLRTFSRRWAGQDFLGYAVRFDDDRDRLVAHYTGRPCQIRAEVQPWRRRIDPQALTTLRRRYPDLDPGRMERIWRTWAARQTEPARNVNAAFLGFCDRYAADERRDRDAPRPALGERANSIALRWWNGLELADQTKAAEAFRICGQGTEWAFVRTDKQLIECAFRMLSRNPKALKAKSE